MTWKAYYALENILSERGLMFEIVMYTDENDKSPVDEFLDNLRKSNFKLYVKTMRTLELLETTGNMLTMPYSKYLQDGVYELRTIQGNNITRLFYFFMRQKIIVVDHGIVKKTQKTPRADIKLAISRRESYERRHGSDLQGKTEKRTERS